eukprot:TRINITY_DN1180_c0_g2_i11.p3 TRINITY_DN1180_c0_g2~~TRINITY_DN1180_c0_g2_i11.p3  ORF type:complete len:189 (-),score=63.94 TRINITY_DN1180_c0_g2_i11:28-594(-)
MTDCFMNLPLKLLSLSLSLSFSLVLSFPAVLIINNQGKPRLDKFFEENLTDEAKADIIQETYLLVSKRGDNVCNFLDGGSCWEEDTKLIYRHYATLYFIFCVDSSESELGILDLIQVFVESLDKCFENVCELDLIFHSDKVHQIVDEIVMGGLVLETNLQEVLESYAGAKKEEESDPLKTGIKLGFKL